MCGNPILFSMVLLITALASPRASAAGVEAETLPPALRRHLRTILAVGAEGAHHAEVARAWRALAETDAKRLPLILVALDDAGPIAANWLRGAIDAICEKTLADHGTLPAEALEALVRDTAHDPRARRVAFEWLARVDATAPDRLIPQMLHDPGSAFRRDAVARLLAEGTRHIHAGRKAAARAVYRQALSGAVDADQVKQITNQLGKLGVAVDLPRHFGFLMEWKLIGPFENTDHKCFDVAYPPEKAIDLAASCPGKFGPVKWIDAVTSDDYGVVNLNKLLGGYKDVIAYAFAEFTAQGLQPAELRVGTYNGIKVWLNGALLFAQEEYHHGSAVDQYRMKATFRPGRNTILVKVSQNNQKESWAQHWEFQLRVCDATGAAILSTTRPARVKRAESTPSRSQEAVKGTGS